MDRNCPRVLNMLRTYAHSMSIHETHPTAKSVYDPFVVVDDRCFVHRFHFDEMRGLRRWTIPSARDTFIERYAKYGRLLLPAGYPPRHWPLSAHLCASDISRQGSPSSWSAIAIHSGSQFITAANAAPPVPDDCFSWLRCAAARCLSLPLSRRPRSSAAAAIVEMAETTCDALLFAQLSRKPALAHAASWIALQEPRIATAQYCFDMRVEQPASREDGPAARTVAEYYWRVSQRASCGTGKVWDAESPTEKDS